jgi:hypothetical protein
MSKKTPTWQAKMLLECTEISYRFSAANAFQDPALPILWRARKSVHQ